MNVEEMRERAQGVVDRSAEVRAIFADGGYKNVDATLIDLIAADVLALLAERERPTEEHDGYLNAPSVDSAPQMVVGKVLRFEFHRPEHGPIEVATRMFFAWSERAARAAAEGCGEDVTLVLDAPSAVRAVYSDKARLDALLAALRSVDERELPEHVAAALRAVNGSTKSA